MVELWKFRQRMQREGESITEYITALQRDAKYCGFGEYLQKGLRNQLVFGLRNQRIRTRLIEERELTFDKAKQIALSMEASGEGAEVLNRRYEVNLAERKKSQPRRDATAATTTKRLRVSGSLVKFEVDSGSPVSLINSSDKTKYFTDLPLKPTSIELRSYCGSKIKVFGVVETEVMYKGQKNKLHLLVVDAKRHPLLGREWIRALQLDWNAIMDSSVTSVDRINLRTTLPIAIKELVEEFTTVFDDSIGKIEGVQATLHLKPGSKPVFLKSRSIPFSIRDTVEREIHKMVESGILVKVNRSEWATPIVPVMKSANKIRLCGDFKLTVNKSLLVDEHPLPTINEMFSNMAGGEKFTKLDLAQAYLQMMVRPQDQTMLTLNTHLGLYQPTRLMYGVASAPAIFQREISQILHGIPGVSVFLDDVKITGPNDEVHLNRLREVLRRFHEHNMRVNVAKCEFLTDSIEYCGYIIDRRGIHKMPKKVDAIQKMPRPENREQVRAFLGLVNYYDTIRLDQCL
ncbi:uncharacterized protein K02A2.6-like [Toxorhynchites rutilus septentrionalis]|uniref:uncharacterized protein K02A2.6-like n=1 Tax=Toxorhynchites rutilus septentrionalis TaxID=329112 RepID=UPI00247B0518|nr:uncharacterized protein K02A2.6-like [Toxorhynchites rutilus septentrionalis]